MKFTAVSCDCGNPAAHVKFQDERGYKSEGLFSLASGRNFINRLKDGGHMTDAEYAEADAGLVAAGLPEFVSLTDEQIEEEALDFIEENATLGDADKAISRNVDEGRISPADGERISAKIREIVHDPARAISTFVEKLRAELAQASMIER